MFVYIWYMNLSEAKAEFIQAWGILGANWGINKAMAQIQALLLVSPQGLSTEDIMEELQVSRGNVNMNIRALMDWGVVRKELRIGERKEYFVAIKDVMDLARIIANERRKREIQPALEVLRKVQQVEGKEGEKVEEFKAQTAELLEFAEKFDGILDRFSNSDKNWFYKLLLKL